MTQPPQWEPPGEDPTQPHPTDPPHPTEPVPAAPPTEPLSPPEPSFEPPSEPPAPPPPSAPPEHAPPPGHATPSEHAPPPAAPPEHAAPPAHTAPPPPPVAPGAPPEQAGQPSQHGQPGHDARQTGQPGYYAAQPVQPGPGAPPGPPPSGPGGAPMSPGSPPPYGAGPYGSSPYAAPQGPTQPKGLSITALILGVLGCIPFASLAAIIIGIVALVKKQALRGAAIAGIVLGLVWTTGFIAFAMSDLPDKIRDAIREAAEQTDGTGPGPNLDTFSALNLQVGDCLNDPALERDPGLDQIEKVDCSQPHDMEVYHLSTLPDGDYPGDAQIGITASDICVAAFEDFIGTPYDDSELDFYMYYPLESTWTFANDRNVTCAAVDTDSRSTGSLQGANR